MPAGGERVVLGDEDEDEFLIMAYDSQSEATIEPPAQHEAPPAAQRFPRSVRHRAFATSSGASSSARRGKKNATKSRIRRSKRSAEVSAVVVQEWKLRATLLLSASTLDIDAIRKLKRDGARIGQEVLAQMGEIECRLSAVDTWAAEAETVLHVTKGKAHSRTRRGSTSSLGERIPCERLVQLISQGESFGLRGATLRSLRTKLNDLTPLHTELDNTLKTIEKAGPCNMVIGQRGSPSLSAEDEATSKTAQNEPVNENECASPEKSPIALMDLAVATLENLRLSGFIFGAKENALAAWVWCDKARRFLSLEIGIGTLRECARLIENAPVIGHPTGRDEEACSLLSRLHACYNGYEQWCTRAKQIAYVRRPTTAEMIVLREDTLQLVLTGSEVTQFCARCVRSEKLDRDIEMIMSHLSSVQSPQKTKSSRLKAARRIWDMDKSALATLKSNHRIAACEAEKLFVSLGGVEAAFRTLEWVLKAHSHVTEFSYNKAKFQAWLEKAPINSNSNSETNNSNDDNPSSKQKGLEESVKREAKYAFTRLQQYASRCDSWLTRWQELCSDKSSESSTANRSQRGFQDAQKLVSDGRRDDLNINELDKLESDLEDLIEWVPRACNVLLIRAPVREDSKQEEDLSYSQAEIESCMLKGKRLLSRLPPPLRVPSTRAADNEEDRHTFATIVETAARTRPAKLLALLCDRLARIQAFIANIKGLAVLPRFSKRRAGKSETSSTAGASTQCTVKEANLKDFGELSTLMQEREEIFGGNEGQAGGDRELEEILGYISAALKWRDSALSVLKEASTIMADVPTTLSVGSKRKRRKSVKGVSATLNTVKTLKDLIDAEAHNRIPLKYTDVAKWLEYEVQRLSVVILLDSGPGNISLESAELALENLTKIAGIVFPDKDIFRIDDAVENKNEKNKLNRTREKFVRLDNCCRVACALREDVVAVHSWTKRARSILQRNHRLSSVKALVSEAENIHNDPHMLPLCVALPHAEIKSLRGYVQKISTWLREAQEAAESVHSKDVFELLQAAQERPLSLLVDAKPIIDKLEAKLEEECARIEARHVARKEARVARGAKRPVISASSSQGMTERQQLRYLIRTTSSDSNTSPSDSMTISADSSQVGAAAATSAQIIPKSERRCCFCQLSKSKKVNDDGPDIERCGPLIGPFSSNSSRSARPRVERYAHSWCLGFSSEVAFSEPLPLPRRPPDLMDFKKAKGVGAAVSRAIQVRCSHCKRTGATVGCFGSTNGRRCHRTFHYGCLHKAGGQCAFVENALRRDGLIGPLHVALCSHHRLPVRNSNIMQPESGTPEDVATQLWPKLSGAVQKQLREMVYIAEDIFPLLDEDEGGSAVVSGKKRKRSLPSTATTTAAKTAEIMMEIKWLGWSEDDNTYEKRGNILRFKPRTK